VAELSRVDEEILDFFVARKISETVSVFFDIGTFAHDLIWQE